MNRKYNDVKWHKVDNTLQCHDNALNVTNQTHGRAAKKNNNNNLPTNRRSVQLTQVWYKYKGTKLKNTKQTSSEERNHTR